MSRSSRSPAGVAAAVVGLLEVVDVEEEDAGRAAVAPQVLARALEGHLEVGAVEDAGEPVVGGELVLLAHEALVVERHRGLDGERAQERLDRPRSGPRRIEVHAQGAVGAAVALQRGGHERPEAAGADQRGVGQRLLVDVLDGRRSSPSVTARPESESAMGTTKSRR